MVSSPSTTTKDTTNTMNHNMSPCKGLCVLNDDDTQCIVCARWTSEIEEWSNFSNIKKKQIIDQLPQRKRDIMEGFERGIYSK